MSSKEDLRLNIWGFFDYWVSFHSDDEVADLRALLRRGRFVEHVGGAHRQERIEVSCAWLMANWGHDVY